LNSGELSKNSGGKTIPPFFYEKIIFDINNLQKSIEKVFTMQFD
jgi:hypothetical protein